MDLWKEQEEEDRRIFPTTKIDELRVELGRWIKNMNIDVTPVAPGYFYADVQDQYAGAKTTKCQIRIQAMGTGVQEEYFIRFAIDHAGPIAEHMLARWGREFARHRFLKKDALPRVTSRQ